MSILKDKIAALKEPKIFVEQRVQELLKKNIEYFQEQNPKVQLIESDSHMFQLRALSYKEALHSAKLNKIVKNMLPHYAKDEDLDNFVFALYGGETRLQGENPSALYELSIEESNANDIIVPKGLVLSNGLNKGFLKENTTIKAGTLKTTAKVILDKKVEQSVVRLTNIETPFPYILKPKALENFEGGSNKESDEELLQRAFLSLYKYSTAGSLKAYEYFTRTADERISNVKISSPGPSIINIKLIATSNIQDVITNVNKLFNSEEYEKVQAFTDKVNVSAARNKNVTINANIKLLDLAKQNDVKKQIEENFKRPLKIGEKLPISKVYKYLEVANVNEATFTNVDLTVADDQVLNISLNLSFSGV